MPIQINYLERRVFSRVLVKLLNMSKFEREDNPSYRAMMALVWILRG